jgi:transposase
MHAMNRGLTDSQWEVIEKIIDDQCKRWHPLREIVNAILSINRTEAQWRDLDSKYPPGKVCIIIFVSSS